MGKQPRQPAFGEHDPLEGTTPITEPLDDPEPPTALQHSPEPQKPSTALARPQDAGAPSQRALAPIPIVNGRIVPQNTDDLKRQAELAIAAGLAPKGAQNVPQVIMGIAAGMETGLSFVQSCRYVMVVNGTPSLWGDGPLGLIAASGTLEDIAVKWDGDSDNLRCTVTVRRKGVATAQVGEFSVERAKRAGLWGRGGPWKQYPERMLELRARAFALRNLFPDFLMGLGIAEEIQDADSEAEAARVRATANRIERLAPENGSAEHAEDDIGQGPSPEASDQRPQKLARK